MPAAFARSVLLAGAAGAEWEAAALTQLLGAGFDDGVIFVGDAEAEPAPGGWRQQAAA